MAYGWLVVGQSVAAGLATACSVGCTFAVCNMNSAAAVVACGLRYTSVISLCLCMFLYVLFSLDS